MKPSPADNPSIENARRDARRWATLLDDAVRIPGTRIRVGLDALIGLVPGIGDLAGLLLGLVIIGIARRAGAPGGLQWQMLRNLLFEAAVGLVPILGDLFDVAFRANRRNRELLDDFLAPEAPPQAPRWRRWWWLGAIAAVVIGLILLRQLLR